MKTLRILVFILSAAFWHGAYAANTPLNNPVVSAPGTLAALRAIAVSSTMNGWQMSTLGYYTAGDAGSGQFVFNSSSSATDDGGSVIAPNSGSGRWIRTFPGYVTPEMFGMKGDGTTDDYPAWSKLVAYVNSVGSAYIIMGINKTYFFGQYIVQGNGVVTVEFVFLRGLKIDGNGSTIKVKGGFNRAATTTSTVGGLYIGGCSDVSISNLILDGNNSTITKGGGVDPNVNGDGLYMSSDTNVTLTNIISKNWITDCFYFTTILGTNPCVPCQNVQATNCTATYAGRNAMSIIQLRGAIFDGCSFTLSEKSSYGGDAPGAGVDVEPDNSTATPSPNQMTVNTGQLVFRNCIFSLNAGLQVASANANVVDTQTFDNCVISATDTSSGTVFTQIGVPNTIIKNCVFSSVGNELIIDPSTSTATTIVFSNNTVRASGVLILSGSAYCTPIITGNTFISTASTPRSFPSVYLATTNAQFVGNYVYLPKQAFVTGGSGGACLQVSNVGTSVNNTFVTNLEQADDPGSGTAHFYGGSLNGEVNDTFIGTARGAADTFRPINTWAWDTNFPFSQTTPGGVGVGVFAAFMDSANSGTTLRMRFSSAAPTTGPWKRGEIVFNDAPSASGTVGWVCTAAGSPGTWKTFGAIAP